jgi:hypothetical protein
MNKQELLRSNLMQAIGTQNDDLEKHRERLRKMTDKQLLEYGRACRHMCTPEANLGKPPQESSVIHLREARAEWERRHAKPAEKMIAPNQKHNTP